MRDRLYVRNLRRSRKRWKIAAVSLGAALAASLIVTAIGTPGAEEAPVVIQESYTPVIQLAIEETGLALSPIGTFTVTGYCTCVKCCGRWSKDHPSRTGTDYEQRTAGGTVPTAGRTVAVDPRVIPLGSHLWIDGHEYVAEDTGSSVKGSVIDIFFNTHEEAEAFGSQKIIIYMEEIQL